MAETSSNTKNLRTGKKIKKIEEKKINKINKQLRKVSADKEKIVQIRKKRRLFEFIIILILFFFMLILLFNKTFFNEKYETSKIKINIPLLSFFISDNGNEIVLKTLRKSDYLEDYFDSYLSNLVKYNCGIYGFYYDKNTNTAIYDISIEKNIAIKTIKIKYANGKADLLCDN